ncbi:MAG: acyl-CoA desaturase [Candidatus Andersenbacteria bacterium]|nr:acyl-CoA desaturase [Candidatus Andersenbacteria bacterium]MBI3250458.1 acyl-CoA desaturase [Candidatus Andersenbacteria bacterium]
MIDKLVGWASLLLLIGFTGGGFVAAIATVYDGTYQKHHVAISVATWFLATLGITLYYHRFVTHRSYRFSTVGKYVLRPFLAWFGLLSWQGPPKRWCAVHRHHHKHSDQDEDMHSPHAPYSKWWGALWAHTFWIPYAVPEEQPKDLDKFDRVMSRTEVYLLLGPGSGVVLSYLLGGLVGIAWYLASVFVSTCILTWAINSLCHLVGSRDLETGDLSTNVLILGWLTGGEALHNGHHGFQKSPRFAHKPWEVPFDTGYLALRVFEFLGLVDTLKVPTADQVLKRLRTA